MEAVTLYQGFKRAAPRGEAVGSGTWRSRKREGAPKKYFFSFGPSKGPAVQRGVPAPGGGEFYRPGGFRRTDGEPPVVEGAGRRMERRGGRPFRKALGWGLKAGAVVLLLGILVWSRERVVIVLQDVAGLKLNRVSVEGAHYLTEEAVVKAAGLGMGESMFRLDLKGALDGLLALEWVERAFIERRLPSSVVVSIREREPVALVDHGEIFGLDAQGRVLPPSEALLSQDLPLLSGVALQGGAVVGGAREEAFRRGIEFLAFLEGRDAALAQSVSEVNLSEPGVLRVTFVDGLETVFRPPVSEDELRRLALVLGDLSQKGELAKSMDFRFRDMVVVTVRK